MAKYWSSGVRHNAIYVGSHVALLHDVDDEADGCFEVLRDFTIRDLTEMVLDLDTKVEWSKRSPEVPPVLFIEVSFIAKKFFEQVIDDGQRIDNGMHLAVTLDGDCWIRSHVLSESDALEWSEMEDILRSWGSERGCELEYFMSPRTNLPHLWQVSFSYPNKDAKLLEVCGFAQDAIELVRAFPSGSLNPAALRAIVRAGRGSALIGLSEGPSLEAKRPKKLDDLSAKLEMAKDVAAMANSASGGVILVGAVTKTRSGHDIISRLCSCPGGSFDRQVNAVLRQYIYPSIKSLHIEMAAIDDGGQILLIDVPAQPEGLKPFIVHGIEVGGKHIYFSIPNREGEDTFFTTVAEIHGSFLAARGWLDGRSQGSEEIL